MRTYLKLAITALVASAALAALVGSASAGRLSISNQNIRVVWSSLEFKSSGVEVRCRVTIEGSFHTRTIAKVRGSLIGYLTKAIVARPCTGGTAWAHSGEANEVLGGSFTNNLPWHITYEDFAGTLPNITSLRILLSGALFTIRSTIFGITALCEYITGTAGNATGIAGRNTTTGVVDWLVASGRIRSVQGFPCPEGTFTSPERDGLITLLGNTTRITVTLI